MFLGFRIDDLLYLQADYAYSEIQFAEYAPQVCHSQLIIISLDSSLAVLIAGIAQLGEHQTEDLKPRCLIHSHSISLSFLFIQQSMGLFLSLFFLIITLSKTCMVDLLQCCRLFVFIKGNLCLGREHNSAKLKRQVAHEKQYYNLIVHRTLDSLSTKLGKYILIYCTVNQLYQHLSLLRWKKFKMQVSQRTFLQCMGL